MLWNASSMNGYAVVATDGQTGTVSDFIFEDIDWTIKWLVVETGTWLSGRKVYVSVSALGKPDPETRQFSLNMTKDQVENCLSGDIYQLKDYESGAHFAQGEETAVPIDHAGPHFRSLAAMTTATVDATDGEVGHAEDFLIDSDSWQVKYLIVHTANWWPGEKLLISPHSIKGVDYMRSILNLDVTRQFVKDSPAYGADQSVDGAFDESFNSYYGIRFGKK